MPPDPDLPVGGRGARINQGGGAIMIFRLPKSRVQGDAERRNVVTVPMLPLRDIVIFPTWWCRCLSAGSVPSTPWNTPWGKRNTFCCAPRKTRVRTSPGKRGAKTRHPGLHPPAFAAAGRHRQGFGGGQRPGLSCASFCKCPNSSRWRLKELHEFWEITSETEALRRAAVAGFETYAKLNKKVPQEASKAWWAWRKPGRLADLIAGHLSVKADEKQALLENLDANRRWSPSSPWSTGKRNLQIETRIKTGSRSRWKRPSGNTTSMSRCGPSRRRWGKKRT